MSESAKKKKDPSSRYTSHGVDARHFVLETVLNCFSPIEFLILFFIRREKTRVPMSESAKKKKDPSSRKPSHGVVDLLERAERYLEMFLFCFSPLAGVKRENRSRWPFGEYKG